ncbi:MAG: histidine phosphatase family protein, partial [Alphaproteobacteria bacterium]|nr:histidine phosphatase family protein [Alphaproteobacteria bacterium]
MKHIFLLRHAKTVRQVAADESDFDRPLTPRGVRACAIMGQFLRDQGIETVLCSPAARTRETLGRLAPHAGWDIARGRP